MTQPARRSAQKSGALLAALLCLAATAGCSRAGAGPTGAGLCWRASADGRDFDAVAASAPNLESCAAYLERLHLVEGGPVNGAFQGRLIFVTAAEVTASASAGSHRYRVFQPKERAEIDAAIRSLIAEGR